MNSVDLLRALKEAGYLRQGCDKLWWPNAGSFEIVVGAVLTQRTKWDNVKESLLNLKKHSLLDIKALAKADGFLLSKLVKPSGFAAQKSSRLIKLSQNILRDFGSFETFAQSVDKEWLLAQKGLGRESSDAILCYACLRDVMVVDSYALRLLAYWGYEFESYEEAQEWFYEGVFGYWDKVKRLYGYDIDKNTLWARFHGKIVEFCKDNMKKGVLTKVLDI
jgi:endonuclease-3 related protein